MISPGHVCPRWKGEQSNLPYRCFAIVATVLALCAGQRARAHTEQAAPARVEIWPQRSFLMARIAGEGSDLNDIIHATASADTHDHDAPQSPQENVIFTPEIALDAATRARADRYFGTHLMLKQDGVRLQGTLRALRMWRPNSEQPSELRFEALYKFERATQWAASLIVVVAAFWTLERFTWDDPKSVNINRKFTLAQFMIIKYHYTKD